MAKTQMCYFLTVAFYDECDERQTRMLRGYYDEIYAQAICDRLMKYVIDHNKWEVACQEYLNNHPELLAIEGDNAHPKIWRKLEKEWKKANPFSTTAKRHDGNYFITEAPIKTQ